jgi:hypothetical protein
VKQWDLTHLSRFERVWRHPFENGTVTHEVLRLPVGDAIDERHTFSIDRDGAPSEMQEATLRRIYRWDWHAMNEQCLDAGLHAVEGHLFTNDKGLLTTMSLARR